MAAGLKRTYFKDRRIGFFRGHRYLTETLTLTGASAAATLRQTGVSILAGSTGGSGIHKIKLPNPAGAGQIKEIFTYNKSTADIDIRTATTGSSYFFYGTTYNTLRVSTGKAKFGGIFLVSFSSKQWAVMQPGRTSGSTKTDTQPSPFTYKQSTW